MVAYTLISSRVLTLMIALLSISTGLARAEIPVIPLPKSVSVSSGRMPIKTNQSHLIVEHPKWQSFAEVLATDLFRLTGEQLIVASKRKPRPGDIRLAMDSNLAEEEYSLFVRKTAILRASTITGLSHGASTLLQLLTTSKESPSLPFVEIRDEPDVPFRSVMLDLSRQKHSITNIQHVIDLCRFYKVRYIILHLSDDQAWTFPSKAFPALGEQRYNFAYKGPNFEKFSLQEFKDLVAYADARGVTLIPEIDIPGHSGAMRRAAKEAFDPAGVGVVNVATQAVYDHLELVFKEVADVFASSPYIHFGTDEVNLGAVYKAYKDDPWVKERRIKDASELFTKFQEEMILMIERLGRTPLAWEGHRPKKPSKILKRMIWLNWAIGSYPAKDMLRDGYKVVNASFAPNYVIESGENAKSSDVYDWHLGKYGYYHGLPRMIEKVKFTEINPHQKGIIGACMCAWENPGWFEFHGLRRRLAAFSQRTWGSKAKLPFETHLAARKKVDPLLSFLLPDLAEHTPQWDLGSKKPKLEVYEGFGDPDFGFLSGTGFQTSQRWHFSKGQGTAKHHKEGLNYRDQKGHQLAATEGALTLSTREKEAFFSRKIETSKAAGGGPEFWVSFLIRRNGKEGGGGYWRVNHGGVDGSFGHESRTVLRHIRGSGVFPPTKSGEVSFVVINLRPDYVSRLWVNPDLQKPGAPIMLGLRNNMPAMTDLIFYVNQANGNSYTFDEFRIGNSFRAVAPIEGQEVKQKKTSDTSLIKPIPGFDYQPFYPDRWQQKDLEPQMVVWPGKEIAFLTMDATLDPKLMTPFVHRLDQGWKTYLDLIGQNPRQFKHWKNFPVLAAIPDGSLSCGAGCGYVGSTGIELALFYNRDLPNIRKNSKVCPHYIFYEMGRNFYLFGDRHSYFATGFAVFMGSVCLEATDSEDPLVSPAGFEALQKNMGSPKNPLTFIEMFTSHGDAARAEHFQKVGISRSQNSNYAGVMLYLRRHYGGDAWVKRFYHTLRTAEAFPLNKTTAPYQQSLSWVVCASIAAGENLAPLFMERYKFLLSEKDQKTLEDINWKKNGLKVSPIVKKLSAEIPTS